MTFLTPKYTCKEDLMVEEKEKSEEEGEVLLMPSMPSIVLLASNAIQCYNIAMPCNNSCLGFLISFLFYYEAER